MGNQPGLFHVWLCRGISRLDCYHSPCTPGARRLSRLHTHRASHMGAGCYVWCLTRRHRSLAFCRLDDSAPTWSRLERVTDSGRRLRASFEPEGKHFDYFGAGRTRGVSSVPVRGYPFVPVPSFISHEQLLLASVPSWALL